MSPESSLSSPSAPRDSRALKGKRGLQRILNACRYSVDGLRSAWTEEDAFRQELLLAAILVPLAIMLPFNLIERLLLIGSVFLVLIVELVNTAIESTVDRHSFEINPLAKRAKDLGSAAVMLSLVLAGTVWACILWSRFG